GPRAALRAGIALVHQELACCENLSVAENLCLPRMPRRGPWVDRAALDRRAREILDDAGVALDVDRRADQLGIAGRQLLQIAQAVGARARVIVFDEPTSSLSDAEAERLYALIGRLRARGVTCLFVSHRMSEIYRLCDVITVLRDGRHVATRAAAGLPEDELVRL